ncbi:Histone-lysine N-methyltransferase NSD3 [Schistosoma japonicum]|nr:Histone-lysine N-methyltransferase NSD3 [Schistosoma japonicum]
MFQCQGPCGRIVHPHCMRYKTPPPSDNSRPEKFRCPQCLIGEFLCSICGKPRETGSKDGAGQLYACQVINCSRHFHRDCLLGWPGILTRPSDSAAARTTTFQILRCPAHTCNTCYLESHETDSHCLKKPGFNDGPFLECVRCPAVFHTGDLCTPAGSVEVSLSHIVCPRHFDEPLLTLTNFKTQHPNWCFHCYKSAPERIECQLCPTTYHKDCLQPSFGVLTDDKFVCRSCRRGVFPRYAQIVWVKIPQFRWWPCEIIHARNAPINILNMAHPEGSFPVHFLGSDEYQWISRNRVFPYEIGLQTTAAKDTSGSSKIEKAFSRSLHRAPKAHALYVNHVLKQGLPLMSMHAEQLPENELLSLNTLHIENIKKSYESLTLCSCKSSAVMSTDTAASSSWCLTNNECHHFLSRVECQPHICSFHETDCGNRRFNLLKNASCITAPTAKQGDKYAFNVIRTINRGYGLKTLTSFQQGDLVMEYSGEVIDITEANRRIVEALGPNALSNISSSRKGFHPLSETYLARFSSHLNLVLDSGTKGNLSRFINHACEPNLFPECWTVDGYPRLGLFACRFIEANEELTINYIAAQFLSTGLMAASCICLCGADTCISSLRLPISFQSYEEVVSDTSQNLHLTEKRKPKRFDESTLPLEASSLSTPTSKSPPLTKTCEAPTQSNLIGFNPALHEDFCYRCGDGGELILCDKSTCSKSYHLNCLGLSVPPLGIWYCPWHYCDLCGHPSNHLCWRCPNSYCEEHANHNCIQVDTLDSERWKLAKSSLNNVTNSSIVFSVRWICSDHFGLKIYGPDYRPVLCSDSNLSTKKVAANKNLDKMTDEDKQNGGDTNVVKCPISKEKEVEDIVPKTPDVNVSKVSTVLDNCITTPAVTPTTTVINSNNNDQKLEPRRLEPLKVTLKRRLKAELAAKENNSIAHLNNENSVSNDLLNVTCSSTNNGTVTNTLSGSSHNVGPRKRPAINNPLTDKKRTRLSRDNASK